ncbi:MAG TPA: VWA domain-containing protein [Bryobacteraceae bacterium]|nr:VWA domain-containing protein [Bryobacteraceae bacterium]
MLSALVSKTSLYPLCCLLCIFPGVESDAQSAKPAVEQPSADSQAGEISSHDTTATFKSRVNLVMVPVVVRDTQGRAIGALKQEDFQITDKGKTQVITKFSIEKLGIQEGKEPIVDIQAAETPPGQAAPPVAPQRYVAYLFDDVHLKFEDLARVRDAASRHLASLRSTDRAAIYSTSGQTQLDFTDDRDRLHETLLKLRPRPIARSTAQQCPDISYFMADLIQNKNDPQALRAATLEVMACEHLDPSMLQMAQSEARSAAMRELDAGDHETRISFGVIQDVVRRMTAVPGQRSIILVSPGFYATYDLFSYKSDILERAIHANVIINALDARGLYTLTPDASQTSYSADAENIKMQYRSTDASVQADVLAELAEGTGGTFFHNSNDLDGGFQRADSRPEYVYMLGFAPQNLKLDGSFHKLKVTVKNQAKLVLQARRGYYAPRHEADPQETAKQEIREALFSREEMHDLPIELHTQFFKPNEEDVKLAILARVDVRQLQFRKQGGRNFNNLTIVSALFDRNGNFIVGTEKVLEMRLRDETLETKLHGPITVKTDFNVKPGAYLIRLVVRDDEGQLMSATNGSIEIP